jgi:hypothetical protein
VLRDGIDCMPEELGGLDFLPLTVDGDLECLRANPLDGIAVAIDHLNVDRDHVHGAAEHGSLRRGRGPRRKDGERNGQRHGRPPERASDEHHGNRHDDYAGTSAIAAHMKADSLRRRRWRGGARDAIRYRIFDNCNKFR